jgi:tetratricopeptide (TPR) repeat protein
LALAIRAMVKDQAQTHAVLVKGSTAWQLWLDQLPIQIDKSQAPLFQQVSTFLALFYQKSNNWTAAIAVGERAYRMYTQYQAWPRVIQTLKSLTRYYVELGEHEKALSAEEKMLADIPYADSPPGFYAQQLFDVALARVTRGASAQAQLVLDKLKGMDEAKRFGDMLEGLQADIYYQQENYADSIPYYCKLWTLTLQTQQKPFLEQLKQRFLEMEKRLGSESFNRYLDHEMAGDVIRPHEYAASL